MTLSDPSINRPYAAMLANPFSILSMWRGEWVFTSCFDSESEAKEKFAELNRVFPCGQRVLRHRTEVVATSWSTGG